MIDTQLILNELKLLREAVEDMRAEVVAVKNELDRIPKRKRAVKFKPPTLEAVRKYAEERGRPDLADRFYEWYEEAEWKDKKGNRLVVWKNTFRIWEKYNPKEDNTKRSLWQ